MSRENLQGKDRAQYVRQQQGHRFWLAILIICIVVVVAAGHTKNGSDNEKTATEDAKYIEGTHLTQKAVEDICTDAKYGINDKYNPILISDYHFQSSHYAYDENGNTIIESTWNGEQKSNGEKVAFICYVSGGNDDELSVIHIRAGGDEIWKKQSDLDFATYKENGDPMYPDLHN